MNDVEEGVDGEAVCLEDTRTGRDGYICAVRIVITQGQVPLNTILVAGFDHEENEVVFDKRQCQLEDGYFSAAGTDSKGEQFTRTSADMVTDRDSLVNYVKTVDEYMTNEVKKIQAQVQDVGLIFSAWTRFRPCWRDEDGPWKSGEIYFYLVRFTGGLFVVFNGLNAEFEDTTVLLYDGCIEYGATVRNILGQDGVDDGFLEYYWSNPLRNDDLVVDDSGNTIRGLSPGTSVKDGYFLEANLGGVFPSNFVIGSGIYPDKNTYEPEGGMCQDIPDDLSLFAREYLGEFPDFMDQEKPEQPESPQQDDDGGCAIASVGEGNLKAAGLSFVLIAAVMFFGVFGKRCFGRKN